MRQQLVITSGQNPFFAKAPANGAPDFRLDPQEESVSVNDRQGGRQAGLLAR